MKTRAEVAFAWLFGLTGIFALVSALFTWGDGWLFSQKAIAKMLIPWGDLLLTAPLSLLTALGLARGVRWGQLLGLVTAGVYLFGSVLVWVLVVLAGPPFDLQLILPPIAGVATAGVYFFWMLGREAQRHDLR